MSNFDKTGVWLYSTNAVVYGMAAAVFVYFGAQDGDAFRVITGAIFGFAAVVSAASAIYAARQS